MRRLYQSFKRFLPNRLRALLSSVNQRWFARRTLERKYGDWFEVDWREKYATLSDAEWQSAYDRAWRNRGNDCVPESDVELFLSALPGPGTVVDVGCGSGGLAIRLAHAGHRVTGVDVSEVALGLARDRAGSAGVSIEWRRGFAERLPFPDKSFDYLVSAHTLEHVRDLAAATSEFKRVTRRKILVLTPKQTYKRYMDNYHTQFFETEAQISGAFGLKAFRCRELAAGGGPAEFEGAAWFYVGDLA